MIGPEPSLAHITRWLFWKHPQRELSTPKIKLGIFYFLCECVNCYFLQNNIPIFIVFELKQKVCEHHRGFFFPLFYLGSRCTCSCLGAIFSWTFHFHSGALIICNFIVCLGKPEICTTFWLSSFTFHTEPINTMKRRICRGPCEATYKASSISTEPEEAPDWVLSTSR